MTPKTRIMIITSEAADRRIDNFLLSEIKNVPKSRIYRAIRTGEVRVNKKRIKADYRLKLDDEVRIPPISQPEQPPTPKPSNNLVALLQSNILYEDDYLLVINKPAGIAVHGGSGIRLGIIEALRVIYPHLPLELAHRLDRDTSGCLIIAKKHSGLRQIHQQLREGQVKKFYQCLLRGKLPSRKVTVDKPLHKNHLVSGERVVKIDKEQGKPSVTIFTELKRFTQCSLVQAELKTGRTHQIRVHAASLGAPIAGDEKYGDAEFNREMKNQGLKRLFLHAAELTFLPPGSANKLTVRAPLDEKLEKFLEHLT